MAGAHRHAGGVEHGADVVRVRALDDERDDACPRARRSDQAHAGERGEALGGAAGERLLVRGDRVEVHVKLDGDRLEEVRFEGSGCAISTASASMMTEVVKGKTRAEVEAVFRRFHDLVAGPAAPAETGALGKLAVFAGVREFPMRVKCATLAWHTLAAALERKGEPVTTETER